VGVRGSIPRHDFALPLLEFRGQGLDEVRVGAGEYDMHPCSFLVVAGWGAINGQNTLNAEKWIGTLNILNGLMIFIGLFN